MSDDIVTRLNTEEMTKAYYKAFPSVVTLEDAMRQALDAVNEIERLRAKIKAFVHEWELSERGVHNGSEYFASVHKLRQEVRGE